MQWGDSHDQKITSSPPGVSNVYFRVPVTYTASNNIADDQVTSNVTTCINAASFTLKGYIDRNAPHIAQNNTTYQIIQPSFMEKRSCCDGSLPPPCCAVGSIKVSSTKCGKAASLFFCFVLFCLVFVLFFVLFFVFFLSVSLFFGEIDIPSMKNSFVFFSNVPD